MKLYIKTDQIVVSCINIASNFREKRLVIKQAPLFRLEIPVQGLIRAFLWSKAFPCYFGSFFQQFKMAETFLFSSESVNEGHPGKQSCFVSIHLFFKNLPVVVSQIRSAIRCLTLSLMPASVRIPHLASLAVSAKNVFSSRFLLEQHFDTGDANYTHMCFYTCHLSFFFLLFSLFFFFHHRDLHQDRHGNDLRRDHHFRHGQLRASDS